MFIIIEVMQFKTTLIILILEFYTIGFIFDVRAFELNLYVMIYYVDIEFLFNAKRLIPYYCYISVIL